MSRSLPISAYYHQRTKYDPETIAQRGKTLNWSAQPSPFKGYKIGTSYDLKPYLELDKNEPEWESLSYLLLLSYGLTAKLATGGGNFIYLRSAPSAGGLYPAEVYLISRGTDLLPAGLYHYQPQTHNLLRFWDDHCWAELRGACFLHPALEKTQLALVTTAIFYRSAWRYEDRAYRRVFLDTGHLLGNINLAASMQGFRSHLIGGFSDRLMNDLLYLDGEAESVTSVLALNGNPQTSSLGRTTLPSPAMMDYPELDDGELLPALHQASKIVTKASVPPRQPDILEDKYNFPFGLKFSLASTSDETRYNTRVDWGEDLEDLEEAILKRRSTRGYTGEDLTLEELQQLLNFTYHPEDYGEQGLTTDPDYFDLSLIETFVAVSGVEGLDAGCYYYAPKAQELRQIRFKNFREELHYLCLGQNLGRDAGALIFHTADLAQAVARYGDRTYRYLHLDAGQLGQRLNLAAIQLGLGVSGIAGFFDDQVNEVLGIPDDEAVLYITTLGVPNEQ
ncbi:SagB/ThcOx family dehydrogenase [[Limnothrix rosea] IAM M-220]|uniref:SagB/ThcOx family dehydrogenase n=1 Tax=[Limnothrix rosea] IAM M-220 TaxID=454133 RepID=UPI000962C475|nr:SagB/ThcOx family dehydrogenase [[Limnothrix rosea] IAM M-220]OKH18611.1 SagB-type dehydrogenase domain-containing protein [[Limnothrix rosea] IAM M-220]